jgi:cytochrome c-type biogenesis protein CcmE
MKKTHLAAILIIAVAIAVIISTAGDASTYVTFEEAYSLAQDGSNEKIHVVGQLAKDRSGNVRGVNLSADKLSFSFTMVDEADQSQEVVYYEPMPIDFLKSEQVVVIGSYQGDVFKADKILMKCPSKYQENELQKS